MYFSIIGRSRKDTQTFTRDLSNLKPEDIKNLSKSIMINKFKAVIDSQKRKL
jgi:hypothetical protein